MIDFDCQGSIETRRRRGCGYVGNLESAESYPHIHQPDSQGNARVTHFYRKRFALSLFHKEMSSRIGIDTRGCGYRIAARFIDLGPRG